jgi:hypothetical protein
MLGIGVAAALASRRIRSAPGTVRRHDEVSLVSGIVGGSVSAPAARLIYHPRREFRRFGSTAVYFDSTSGNQDPYVWNDVFLHSYCHITQFHAEVGDINVWVSGDRFPEFSSLYCDLVFVVARTCPWTDANDLSRHDPMVDSDEAWADHYRWYPQHPLKRRSRFTLKADPDRSFQPQTGSGDLIDIVPCLREHGITLDGVPVPRHSRCLPGHLAADLR